MLIKTNMWQPAIEARQYEAAGSRTSFSERWNPHNPHSFHVQKQNSDALRLLLNVLTYEQKAREAK